MPNPDLRSRAGLIALLFVAVAGTLAGKSAEPPTPPTETATNKDVTDEDAAEGAIPDDGASATNDGPEVVRAFVAGRPGHRDVRTTHVLIRDGGRMDWSAQDRIAYDKRSEDGYYDIYVADTAGLELRCITCENFAFHRIHALAPAWHPSGDYLVVQVQTAARKLKMEDSTLATPFRGLFGELWAITADGKQYWQLTTARDRGSAVLDPVFSHEADHLAWSERISTHGGRRFGQWGTRLATFDIRRGVPRLGKIRTVLAGEHRGLEVAQSFTPDDRGLLVAASPMGQPDEGIDVVRIGLTDGNVADLTSSPEHADLVARYAPDDRHIAFTSDRGIEPLPEGRKRLPWRQDVWLMITDGGEQERLTFFNHPDSDHFLEHAMISDIAWSPDGDRLLIHVVSANALTVEQAIWIVVLDETYRR